MAHPKRKISKQRQRKRRTHQKIAPLYLATCSTTGLRHPLHQAYEKEGKVYYKGKLLMVRNEKKKSA